MVKTMSKIVLSLPCQGTITQLFGENVQYYTQWGYCCGHNGIDWGIANGTTILAAAAGEVNAVAFENGGYGNYVKLRHDFGYTYYAHLKEALVKKGDKVNLGERIALSDNTGASTGPHLHFGLKIPGSNPGMKDYVDPAPYFGFSPYEPPEEEQRYLTVQFSIEVIVNELRVREGAGTQYAHVGDVNLGQKFDCNALTFFVTNCQQEAWFRYADGTYKGMWSAGVYLGEAYVKQVEV